MIKLIDLNYHTHSNVSEPGKVMELQKASIGFVKFIKEKLTIQLIKHINCEGEEYVDGIKYNFFKSRNKFWHIPFKTHRYIKTQHPDIVLIQGLIFPIQLIALKLKLGKNAKIMVQHHGEKPFTGIKKLFQQIADRFINGYLFTSLENANEWVENKIISDGFLFERGNEESLLNILLKLDNINRGKLSISIVEYFNNSLSFTSISDTLYPVCEKLISK